MAISKWGIAALPLMTVMMLGWFQTPLPQPQPAASLVERVAALEMTVAAQAEQNEQLAQRVAQLETVVGISPTPTVTPTNTPTRTPTPSPMPTATHTPSPTSTTAPPEPYERAATCAEILQVWREGTTDEFLALRRTRVIDRWLINWEGWVSRVHSELDAWNNEYYIIVDQESDDLAATCGAYITLADQEAVLRYREGQRLRVTGRIEDILIVFGYLALYLESDTVTIEMLD